MPEFSSWRVLSSLKQRNFRLYYLGQFISLNGSWMQNTAQAWLVYRLTGSSFMLGLAGFFGLLPILLFGLWGGVVADHFSRRRLFISAQVLALCQALILAVLTLGGWIQVWHVLVLAFMLGTVHAFEFPARHAFIAGLVPREDLPNAVALNSSLFNLGRFFGPAVAGLLVAWQGEGLVFLINAISFLAVVVAFSAMRLQTEPPRPAVRPRLADGLRFAWNHRSIRAALWLVGTASLVGMSSAVLLPVFAREIHGGGAEWLGLMLASSGAGALLSALSLAWYGRSLSQNRIAAVGIAAGLCWVVFSWLDNLPAAMLVLLLAGFCFTTLIASSNAFLQSQVDDAMRGRVMALFSVIFLGMAPLGQLAAGSLGAWIGAPLTVRLFGLFCTAGSLLVLQYGLRQAKQVEEHIV